jgi:uncharacterized RDD family membrane protein YckC
MGQRRQCCIERDLASAGLPGYPLHMQQTPDVTARPPEPTARSAQPAHVGWRLLAMIYDLFPALALWFATCYAIELTHQAQPMASLRPDPVFGYVELALLWLIPGAYLVISWRRGGATIGMRPWRLKVLAADGYPATLRALSLRYVVATLSLLACGLGFGWALFDSERRCWHDIVAGTRFVRMDSPG